jgi:hypothetical protein
VASQVTGWIRSLAHRTAYCTVQYFTSAVVPGVRAPQPKGCALPPQSVSKCGTLRLLCTLSLLCVKNADMQGGLRIKLLGTGQGVHLHMPSNVALRCLCDDTTNSTTDQYQSQQNTCRQPALLRRCSVQDSHDGPQFAASTEPALPTIPQ